MTLQQIAEKVIADIRRMTLEEKAHLRSEITRAFRPDLAAQKIAYKM